MKIERDNIKYVRVNNFTITFELEEGTCCSVAYTYVTKDDLLKAISKFVDQYDLYCVPGCSGVLYMTRYVV